MLEPAEQPAQVNAISTTTATRLGFPRRHLRVAWLAPSLARGWRWQAVFREFTKLFPETVVFTNIWPGFTPGFERSFKVRRLRGTKVLNIGSNETGSARTLTWVSPLAVWQLLRFRPEVILTNGFHACTLYALLVKMILRVRVILLWQGVSSETGGGKGSLRLAYRRLIARFLDLVATNTQDSVEYLERLVRTPPSKILHFTGEVADIETLRRTEHDRTAFRQLARPVFLFVGTPTRGKGVDKLLEAYRRLLQCGMGPSSLAIVGDGPESADLRQFARDLRIDKRIRWEGFVPYEALGAYYANCDVLVLPSLEDTWGVVVQEAMAFGKAVLCSRYAGVREVVEHGINGFIFDARNPEELADYMAQFIREPDLIEKCGMASREISERHTPEVVAHRLACALAKALAC